VAFAVFFLLGYLLFSTLYAAIGAITTTEQEGQQLQFVVVIPLVLSVFMLSTVMQAPTPRPSSGYRWFLSSRRS